MLSQRIMPHILKYFTSCSPPFFHHPLNRVFFPLNCTTVAASAVSLLKQEKIKARKCSRIGVFLASLNEPPCSLLQEYTASIVAVYACVGTVTPVPLRYRLLKMRPLSGRPWVRIPTGALTENRPASPERFFLFASFIKHFEGQVSKHAGNAFVRPQDEALKIMLPVAT